MHCLWERPQPASSYSVALTLEMRVLLLGGLPSFLHVQHFNVWELTASIVTEWKRASEALNPGWPQPVLWPWQWVHLSRHPWSGWVGFSGFLREMIVCGDCSVQPTRNNVVCVRRLCSNNTSVGFFAFWQWFKEENLSLLCCDDKWKTVWVLQGVWPVSASFLPS